MQDRTEKLGLSAETRAVLDVVLDALDIPHAATVGHAETRARILDDRLMNTVVYLRSIANRDDAKSLTTDLGLLLERLDENPAAGYVTHDQAHTRIIVGASWSDAISLDYQGPNAEPGVSQPTGPDEDECGTEFIDGSWTFDKCGCIECRTRIADDPGAQVRAAETAFDESWPLDEVARIRERIAELERPAEVTS
jgi:hypothetical protein